MTSPETHTTYNIQILLTADALFQLVDGCFVDIEAWTQTFKELAVVHFRVIFFLGGGREFGAWFHSWVSGVLSKRSFLVSHIYVNVGINYLLPWESII